MVDKRITFTKYDAIHIYEWLVMYWNGDDEFGDCHQCQKIGERLEKFIGNKNSNNIRKVIKKSK